MVAPSTNRSAVSKGVISDQTEKNKQQEAEKEQIEGNKILEYFIKAQTEDKQNTFPPIRLLVMGDDKMFNRFVSQYVKLLDLDQTEKVDKKSNDQINSNSQQKESGGGFTIDKNKIDIRVFLVPQNENTLGHYLAMYDDLYCQNIYNFFNSNHFLSMCLEHREHMRDYGSISSDFFKEFMGIDGPSLIHQNLGAQMIERQIQYYLRDAVRSVEVKIFKAVIHYANMKKPITYYFVNRFELGYAKTKGTSSVYDKLEAIRNMLIASTEHSLRLAAQQAHQHAQRGEGGLVDGID